jgi:hypothetical protein
MRNPALLAAYEHTIPFATKKMFPTLCIYHFPFSEASFQLRPKVTRDLVLAGRRHHEHDLIIIAGISQQTS